MSTFEKSLHVTKTDTYTYTVPLEWLGSDTISSHDVTAGPEVTKNSSGVTANVIAVSITGLSVGNSELHFEYTTNSGRSDCKKTTVKVIADC